MNCLEYVLGMPRLRGKNGTTLQEGHPTLGQKAIIVSKIVFGITYLYIFVHGFGCGA